MLVKLALGIIVSISKIKNIKTPKDLNKIGDDTFNSLEDTFTKEHFPITLFLGFIALQLFILIGIDELFPFSAVIHNILSLFIIVDSGFLSSKIKEAFLKLIKNEKAIRQNKKAMNLYLK